MKVFTSSQKFAFDKSLQYTQTSVFDPGLFLFLGYFVFLHFQKCLAEMYIKTSGKISFDFGCKDSRVSDLDLILSSGS